VVGSDSRQLIYRRTAARAIDSKRLRSAFVVTRIRSNSVSRRRPRTTLTG